jgi:hypothetical protein
MVGLPNELLYKRALTEYLYREFVGFRSVFVLLGEISFSLHVRWDSRSVQKFEIDV